MIADEREHGDPLETVEEAQFRDTDVKSSISSDSGRLVLPADEPEHVRPPEALVGGVGVAGLVRVLVVLAMLRRPPERAAHDRHAADERQHELEKRGSS